jgi:hypothetical protein
VDENGTPDAPPRLISLNFITLGRLAWFFVRRQPVFAVSA